MTWATIEGQLFKLQISTLSPVSLTSSKLIQWTWVNDKDCQTCKGSSIDFKTATSAEQTDINVDPGHGTKGVVFKDILELGSGIRIDIPMIAATESQPKVKFGY